MSQDLYEKIQPFEMAAACRDDFYRRERKQKLRRHRVVHSHVHEEVFVSLSAAFEVPWDGVLEENRTSFLPV